MKSCLSVERIKSDSLKPAVMLQKLRFVTYRRVPRGKEDSKRWRQINILVSYCNKNTAPGAA